MYQKTKIIPALLFFFSVSAILICTTVLTRSHNGVLGAFTKHASYAIVLTKDGFSPKLLTIQAGDTVVFSTTAGKPYWPASNLHPTHELYPAFDPKTPIAPGKTWSFTFDKEGSWKFHDHLNSVFTGEITVKTIKKQ